MIAQVVLALAAAAAIVTGSLRWLRVAQREHYLPGEVSRAQRRWLATEPETGRGVLYVVVALVGLADAWAGAALPGGALPGGGWPAHGWVAVAAAAYLAVVPRRLGVRGRTSRLAWTRRLRVLAAVAAVPGVALVAVGAGAGRPAAGLYTAAALAPQLVDVALWATRPLERRLARRYVTRAVARLDAVAPTRVAITGSYGKTTVKGYVRHLLAGSRSVVASPASFNNTAGLSRAVNEQLVPGTEVFVAEMGTYGPGEIREMCTWVRPDVAVICAIGPVHLERMGSLDGIVAAKSEILEGARTAVLNVDAHGLAAVAERFASSGGTVVRCAEHEPGADVVVRRAPGGLAVTCRGEDLGTVAAPDAHPANVACALGVALALGVRPEALLPRLGDLPGVEHRQQVSTTAGGVTVIDNSFNSNPASARTSLELLERLGGDGRRVVVTPGMVELGALQDRENREFAARAAATATHLLLVGRTNRRALREGATGGAEVVVLDTRDDAVEWVRAHLAPGDVVLYENDLPDHYP